MREMEHLLLDLYILNLCLMSKIYELILILIFVDFKAWSALRESVKIQIFLSVFSKAISKASFKATHSAVNTDEQSVKRCCMYCSFSGHMHAAPINVLSSKRERQPSVYKVNVLSFTFVLSVSTCA